jgi:superkiller protein 3
LVQIVVLLCALGGRAVAEDREPFAIARFENTKQSSSYAYLEAGLPALIAERFSGAGRLRFVGGPGNYGQSAGARWVVEGRFTPQPNWRIEIQIQVRKRQAQAVAGAQAGSQVAAAVRTGSRLDLLRLASEAAGEAFAAALALPSPVTPVVPLKPFGRDPYAFVLYGRGASTYWHDKIHQRQSEKTKRWLDRSLLIDPAVPETLRLLGQLHLDTGHPEKARSPWTQALSARPNYVAVHVALAQLDRAERSPSAEARYAQVVALDPYDTDARQAHGEILFESGKLAAAQAELEKVIQGRPDDVRAHRTLALILASRRAGPDLAAQLENVLRLDPDNLEARIDLAAAYLGLDRFSDAEATYTEILRHKPRHPGALKLAGDLAWARRDTQRALALYRRLRWIVPDDPRPFFLLGAIYYETGNWDAAQRVFTEGAYYAGMRGAALSNLGAVALRRGRPREALWLLAEAVKHQPGKALVRYNYAIALRDVNRHVDALNQVHAAAALDAADASIHFFAGVLALRLGLLREAAQSFREAARLDPKHESARHNLALLGPVADASGK